MASLEAKDARDIAACSPVGMRRQSGSRLRSWRLASSSSACAVERLASAASIRCAGVTAGTPLRGSGRPGGSFDCRAVVCATTFSRSCRVSSIGSICSSSRSSSSACCKLLECRRAIAETGIAAHQRPVDMLQEWINLQQAPTVNDCLIPAPFVHSDSQQGLQCRHQAHAIVLTLHQAPIVEDAFDEVAAVENDSLLEAWQELRVPQDAVVRCHGLGEVLEFRHVDPMVRVRNESRCCRDPNRDRSRAQDQSPSASSQPPKLGIEAALRARFLGFGPELSRERRAGEFPLSVDDKVRKQ